MSVAVVGTGLSTFALALFRRDCGAAFFEDARLCSEGERMCFAVRPDDDDREGTGGASPKMKNFIKAPINRTTESWPRSSPCVKVKDEDILRGDEGV